MATLPLVMSPSGLQPQAPADLRAQLVAKVAASNPDYTANLPAALVEDVASTSVAAIVESDSFLVDLVNAVTPNGANPFILALFGQLYGLGPAVSTNVSVFVTISGPPGFVIVEGFTVGDGLYQYVCPDGAIIGSDGQTLPIYAVAVLSGNWAVPAGSVTQIITSVPAQYQLTCINVEDGIPSVAAENESDYRDRVMTAGLASSTGMSRYLKTLVSGVPGTQARLVSVRLDPTSGRYIAIIGGGDPVLVGYAVWKALFWSGGILSAPILIDNITAQNPAVISTAANHNLMTGMVERIDGVVGGGSLQAINGQSFPVTVLSPTTFSVPFDATMVNGIYYSGGTVSPNPIVEEVTITDYPDVYVIPYVIPPQETVTMVVTWETDSPHYVAPQAIAQAAAPALVEYVNSLPVGTAPLNIYDMQSVFIAAVAAILPAESITILAFAVAFDGVAAQPMQGTGVIYGDVNSYFYADLSGIVVQEGGVG